MKQTETRINMGIAKLDDHVNFGVTKRLENMSDMIQERVGFQRMKALGDLSSEMD